MDASSRPLDQSITTQSSEFEDVSLKLTELQSEYDRYKDDME